MMLTDANTCKIYFGKGLKIAVFLYFAKSVNWHKRRGRIGPSAQFQGWIKAFPNTKITLGDAGKIYVTVL